ncbi:MAG: type II toxin-antitoxin system HicA family toxin [Gammaproteobacteria bacterium]|nr:type II toxin-antitoxin system HicA family toxin [Gammaproteobacteria bacterium]MCY4312488.1 type II toxin-antitoxin system HicA family toxin [Gammaproteobacteria bacterium]
MGRLDKLKTRFKSKQKDFTWNGLFLLLEGAGYSEAKSGKTVGSRYRFIHAAAPKIILHKPTGNIVRRYVITDVFRILIDEI